MLLSQAKERPFSIWLLPEQPPPLPWLFLLCWRRQRCLKRHRPLQSLNSARCSWLGCFLSCWPALPRVFIFREVMSGKMCSDKRLWSTGFTLLPHAGCSAPRAFSSGAQASGLNTHSQLDPKSFALFHLNAHWQVDASPPCTLKHTLTPSAPLPLLALLEGHASCAQGRLPFPQTTAPFLGC